ncbi:hypothetical protein [Pedococcus sp. P5_B7]
MNSARISAALTNARLVNDAFDTPEAARKAFNRFRTIDPFPEVEAALLNVADVADYLATTGMVYPARASDLKSASLRIRIAGDFRYVDAAGRSVEGTLLPRTHPEFALRNATERFVLEGNTIAFLTLEPIFQIPDYMAMRFNLVIDHVYKGLLLGTGPLVDPGYVGKLHIPLHNLTQKSYEFRAGAPLIWAEFTKLSRNRVFQVPSSPSNPNRQGEFTPFVHYGSADSSISSFLRDAVGSDKPPQSSIPAAIATAVQAQEESAKTARSFRTISIGAVLGALLAFGGILLPVIQMVQTANNDLRQSEVRNVRLEQRISRLESRISTTGPTSPPSSP